MTPDYALHPVAVHVFVLRGDQVLLLRRANTGYEDGKLSVPAGHVERGETVTGAALRETLEEVGLTLDAGRLRVVGVMHKSVGNRIDFFLSYALEMAEGEPSNLEPEKCSELLWSALRAPPADTISYVRAALANFIVGRWFDEHGGPLR